MPAAPSSGVERLSTSAATCAKTTSTARRNPARSRDKANNSSRDMPATSAPSRAHTASAAVRMGAVINVMKTVNHHPLTSNDAKRHDPERPGPGGPTSHARLQPTEPARVRPSATPYAGPGRGVRAHARASGEGHPQLGRMAGGHGSPHSAGTH